MSDYAPQSYLYVRVNHVRIYLDMDALERGVFDSIYGDSEQCEDCGHDWCEEDPQVHPAKDTISCGHCGSNYLVETDERAKDWMARHHERTSP